MQPFLVIYSHENRLIVQLVLKQLSPVPSSLGAFIEIAEMCYSTTYIAHFLDHSQAPVDAEYTPSTTPVTVSS